MIRRFRNEFDAPHVPFLIGQLGQFPERPWNEDRRRVDRAHRELAKQVSPCVFISSDDLTHRGDKTHFDAASYREFGKRYARAFLEMSREASGKQ